MKERLERDIVVREPGGMDPLKLGLGRRYSNITSTALAGF